MHATDIPTRASVRLAPPDIPAQPSNLAWASLIAALSVFTLLLHGYHPFAEDGGLYVAGVQYTLNPSLFPHDTAFVTAHLHYSVFAPLLAALVRSTHLPFDWAILLAYLSTVVLTFVAAHQLLRRCFASAPAQLAGLALLAAWWTLPVAGTSLLLMDPYLTARSFSTPLSLLAIAFALDPWPTPQSQVPHVSHLRGGTHTKMACALCLILAVLFHPLMAGYAFAFVLALRILRIPNPRLAIAALCPAALALAAVIEAHAPAESPAAVLAAYSRYYWFLSQWHWYELCGLAGPLLIFALLLRTRLHPPTKLLLRAAILIGLLATLIAALFAHHSAPTHLVARLQPLRAYLLLYAIMALLLGASLTQLLIEHLPTIRSRSTQRLLATTPVSIALALCAISYLTQRATFPASPHIEFPSHEPHHPNPWVQAYLWSRAHTPQDAVFALDAKYINQPGEDAQTFRAWAQRSVLPDFSKDGGEAAITPALAPQWLTAATAQRGLSTEDDNLRDPRILPLGATWMIVHSSAPTHHPCPYDNATVKVCRLTP
jgi:hypothetical protein